MAEATKGQYEFVSQWPCKYYDFLHCFFISSQSSKGRQECITAFQTSALGQIGAKTLYYSNVNTGPSGHMYIALKSADRWKVFCFTQDGGRTRFVCIIFSATKHSLFPLCWLPIGLLHYICICYYYVHIQNVFFSFGFRGWWIICCLTNSTYSNSNAGKFTVIDPLKGASHDMFGSLFSNLYGKV